MKDYINPKFPHLVHGADYNPEQWIDYPGVWDEDMRLMRLADMNEMTVGIFSWSRLEPREGEYDFSFLDEIIDRVYQNGGRVILATPSGARPHWLAEKYPEVLRVDPNGIRNLYGQRHNHCYTSPLYREKVGAINRRLAERYGKHPAVIAWHLSNEYNGDCHCALCQEAFRAFCRKRYGGDIDKLNHAWWTAFWSHTYDSFDQIEIPSWRGETSVHGLSLDYRRFISAQTGDFIRAELAPIRELCPDVPVTINMMPKFTGLNYRDYRDILDFASIDVYPDWHKPGAEESTPLETAFWHDYYRALYERPFFLMESAPGLTNWKPYNKLKRPGMDRAAALQAVAHGSDSVQYFQFRKSRGSSEKFHGAVVDHVGNEDTRIFRAVQATGASLRAIDELCGSGVEARVAIILDVENLWALLTAQGFVKENKRYLETLYEVYRPFWRRGIAVDIVDAHRDLSRYSLVVAPMLYMVDGETGASLTSYVKRGGYLLSGYMLGMVNETDLCHLGGFPGAGLRELFALRNEEIDTLYPGERFTVSRGGKSYEGLDYAELLRPEGCEILARYTSEFYSGMPAETRNRFGEGTAHYIAFRDTGDFFEDTVARVIEECSIPSPFAALDKSAKPSLFERGVTAHTRSDGEHTYLFLENYSGEERTVELPAPAYDLEAERKRRTVTLAGYDVKIFRI